MRVFITKFAVISSISVGSWLAGTYYERRSIRDCLKACDLNALQNHLKEFPPALPIFGTVSAATVITEKNVSPAGSRTSAIMKHGFPSLDNIRSFENFVLSYDRRNRVAHWVFEHITKDNLKYGPDVDRTKSDFYPDESIHPFFRSENADYFRSGYDRGHLAAAGNHKANQRLINQTFVLSNVAPQVGKGFNRGIWNNLEKHVRRLAKTNKQVYCCTGPLYLPKKAGTGKHYVNYEVIGANMVAVPTHFFKVIVVETLEGNYEMESYVLPNLALEEDTPLHLYQVPPESVERSAGLLFFDKLSRSKLKRINGKALK